MNVDVPHNLDPEAVIHLRHGLSHNEPPPEGWKKRLESGVMRTLIEIAVFEEKTT